MLIKKEVRLAFIDNSIDCSVYNPEEHWRPYIKGNWDSFKAIDHQFPDFRKVKYTHLLLTGSEASIVIRDKWAEEEAEIIQEAVERGIPVLGSCYGHQLLAYALLGSSSVRRSPQPEVGWIPVQIVKESRILGKKRQAFSFSVHFDEVVNLNEDFHILASTEYCPVQAFQVKDKQVWGLQIHPEINIENARILLKNLIALKLDNTSIYEKALNSRPRDSGLIKQITECFLSAEGY
jgi:GMP synthase-like glutamine amidotransferase